MTKLDEPHEAPLTSPDPFSLAKEVRVKVKSCCGGIAEVNPEKVEYLWIHLGKNGTCGCTSAAGGDGAPSLEHWLNVVDEAASLGVKSLVLSIDGSLLDKLRHVIDVCQWAQDAHNMCVAIHTTAAQISEPEVQLLKRLNLELVRLFVSVESLPNYEALGTQGIRVCPAEAAQKTHGCGMPQKMLFVNASGQLYTCGTVQGQAGFHLGDIYNRTFDKVMADPALPHAIPMETPMEEHGCDGCPPLLADLLKS